MATDARSLMLSLCTFFFFLSPIPLLLFFFFFNDTATTEIYTLSLHDALPIYVAELAYVPRPRIGEQQIARRRAHLTNHLPVLGVERSEEHTSELQSQSNLVCRLLLEKKKKKKKKIPPQEQTTEYDAA